MQRAFVTHVVAAAFALTLLASPSSAARIVQISWSNPNGNEPLRVVFFMASPELVEEFRALHERVTSDPDRPITAEEREAIERRIGGSRTVLD